MKLSSEYVTGFCEGECAFTYSTVNGGKNINPVFSIRQNISCEDLIYRVHEFFEVGSVYTCKSYRNTSESVYYKVTSKGELGVIVDHFTKHRLASNQKASVFEVWREMVDEYIKKPSNQNEIKRLSELLSSLQLKSKKPF